MSVRIDGNSGSYLGAFANIGAGASNLTAAAWINLESSSPSSGGGGLRYAFANETSGNGVFVFRASGAALQVLTFSGGGEKNLGLGTLTLGQWYHVALTTDGTTMRGYLNGVEITSTSAYASLGSGSGVAIGAAAGAYSDRNWYGLVAETGIWGVALSASDIASLAAGLSCKKIRPDALVFATPLIGLPASDIISGANGAVNGGCVSDGSHPRIYL